MSLEPNRIYCGDCLDLMREIPDKSIDMILCDLPYGITNCKWDTPLPMDQLWERYNRIIKDTGNIVLFSKEPLTSSLILNNLQMFKYKITWDKLRGAGHLNSHKRPLTQTEDICLFCKANLGVSIYNPQLTNKEPWKIRPPGNRKPCKESTHGAHKSELSKDYDKSKSHPTDIIKIPSYGEECNSIHRVHPTQKPVALFEYLIRTYSNEGDTILDNCMGSGTTCVACKKLGRNFIGIEKEPVYIKIANKRLEKVNNHKITDFFGSGEVPT